MTLEQFIDGLKQALNIQSLSPRKQGYSLLFDDTLAVDVLTARGELILLSPVPQLADNDFQKEQQLKQAMAWSLPWGQGDTCLAQQGNTVMVQTRASLQQDFEALRELLNSHCQYVEQLEQLELQAVQQVYQDVFIRP